MVTNFKIEKIESGNLNLLIVMFGNMSNNEFKYTHHKIVKIEKHNPNDFNLFSDRVKQYFKN